jgi:hypothetical protein
LRLDNRERERGWIDVFLIRVADDQALSFLLERTGDALWRCISFIYKKIHAQILHDNDDDEKVEI